MEVNFSDSCVAEFGSRNILIDLSQLLPIDDDLRGDESLPATDQLHPLADPSTLRLAITSVIFCFGLC